jgi:hypothetical protein
LLHPVLLDSKDPSRRVQFPSLEILKGPDSRLQIPIRGSVLHEHELRPGGLLHLCRCHFDLLRFSPSASDHPAGGSNVESTQILKAPGRKLQILIRVSASLERVFALGGMPHFSRRSFELLRFKPVGPPDHRPGGPGETWRHLRRANCTSAT